MISKNSIYIYRNGRETGAALIEWTFIAPILLFLALSLVDVCNILIATRQMTVAVMDGARQSEKVRFLPGFYEFDGMLCTYKVNETDFYFDPCNSSSYGIFSLLRDNLSSLGSGMTLFNSASIKTTTTAISTQLNVKIAAKITYQGLFAPFVDFPFSYEMEYQIETF